MVMSGSESPKVGSLTPRDNVSEVIAPVRPTNEQLRVAEEFAGVVRSADRGVAVPRWLGGQGTPAPTVRFLQTPGLIAPGSLTLEGWDLMYWMAPNSDFSGWKFIGAILDGFALPNTRLTGCDFTGASMIAAVLSRALLDGAKLIGADLTRAVLSGADLRGANLTAATLVGTNLAYVKFDEYTRFDGALITGVILSPGVEITKDGSIRSR